MCVGRGVGGVFVCVWGGGGGILKTYFREKKSPLQLRMCVCVRIYTFSCSAFINKHCNKET